VTIIFAPYKIAKRVLYTVPSLTLNGYPLDVVNSYKYLGLILSCFTDDNTHILRQMSQLYARTNVLLRKFSKCSLAVKLCLFRAHCIQFYGASLRDRFNKTVMKRFEAAHVKCVKVFFRFARLDSVTSMFCELGLPTFNTVLHYAKFSLNRLAKFHTNIIVRLSYEICVVNRC